MSKKGGKQPGAGRPPGSKSWKNREWEKLGEFITETGAQRAMKVLMQMDDKTFLDMYMKALEYFKPKLARTEIKDADSILSRPVIVLPEMIEKLNNNDKKNTAEKE